jgi:hypothetical protein
VIRTGKKRLMNRGDKRNPALDPRRKCRSNKSAQTRDWGGGDRFSKAISSIEPLLLEAGLGQANSQKLISFFVGILPAIQNAMQVPSGVLSFKHGKWRQK